MRRFVFISAMEGSAWGGSEELWAQAALRMARDGARVSACTGYWKVPRPQLEQLSRAGVELYERELKPSLWSRISRKLGWSVTSELISRREAAWLSRQRPDLVCISQGGVADGLPWMLHCRQEGLAFAPIAQANVEWLWPDDRSSEKWAQAYKSARRSFFVSRRNKELLEDQMGLQVADGVVISNPFNVRYEAQPPWPDPARGWRLGCVARLDPVAKGQDLLLRVLMNEKWKKRNLRVSFYGTGRCERNLQRLAARLGATAAEFKGHTSEVEAIWAENHALILPSRYEGTPLALVEAMLCARAAIVTDVAGNTELVEEGSTGFVAEAPTVPLLDLALERAWQQRSRWLELGRAARERIRAVVPEDPVRCFCDQLLELVEAGVPAARVATTGSEAICR